MSLAARANEVQLRAWKLQQYNSNVIKCAFIVELHARVGGAP